VISAPAWLADASPNATPDRRLPSEAGTILVADEEIAFLQMLRASFVRVVTRCTLLPLARGH